MHTPSDLATQRRDEPIEKNLRLPRAGDLFSQPADAAEKIRSYIKGPAAGCTALETCTAADLAQLAGGAMPAQHGQISHACAILEPATILDYFADPLLILEGAGLPAGGRARHRVPPGRELSALLEDRRAGGRAGWLSPRAAGSGRSARSCRLRENLPAACPDVPLKTIVNAPMPTRCPPVARCGTAEDIQLAGAAARRVTVMASTPVRRRVWPPTLRTKG